MSRRSRNHEIVTIKWRDIPAQINGRFGEDRHQFILPRRFQRSIDEAAMVAGKKTASEYVEQWRRDTTVFNGDSFEMLKAAVETRAVALEAAFDRVRLAEFVAAGGWDPNAPDASVLLQ